MAQRRMRRQTWIKSLLVTALLGGGAAGGYQMVAPEHDALASADPATLDAVQDAWDNAPAAGASSLIPATNRELPAAPAAPVELPTRYQPTGLPFPLASGGEVTTRGQSPLNEYPLPAAPASNPLRAPSAPPAEAAQAFESADLAPAPPAAVAAFADQDVIPTGAMEPLPSAAPAPLDRAAGTEVPLAALPQASSDEMPEPFAQQAPAPLAELPMEVPNPLRSVAPVEPPPTVPAEPYYEPPAESQAPPAPMPSEDHSALIAPMQPAPIIQPLPDSMTPAAPQPMAEFASPMEPQAETTGGGRPGERALEGQQQPSLAIQKFAPAEIQVGKPCTFQIKVRNNSSRPAHDVIVRDQPPAGARLTATQPQADLQAGNVQWNLGTLAPGEEKTLHMELTPTEEGTIGSVARVSFAAEASVQTRCTRPQLALRMTAPSQVLVGQQQQIQIEIKNPGTGDATGVVILENVPENLRHAAGATLEFEVGTLRAGETRRLQLNMVAETPGKVVNLLTAQADGNLHVDQKVEFEVVAPALEVAVEGPRQRYLERPAQYTVKIGNPGTASARDLKLVTHLPRGMRFVQANNLGEYDAGSHAVYWSLAELPAGESGAVQLTAMPVSAGDHRLQVKAETRDGLKDQTEHGTRVDGIAAIKFTVTDLEDPIEIGGQTEYEVRVANQGTKAATNVVVRAAAPAGMKVVSATGDARSNLEAGAVRFAPIRQLPPGSEVVFRLRVQGAQAGDHRLVVEVSSDDLSQPVRKEESTRVFGDN